MSGQCCNANIDYRKVQCPLYSAIVCFPLHNCGFTAQCLVCVYILSTYECFVVVAYLHRWHVVGGGGWGSSGLWGFWWYHAMVTWASVIGRHIAWFAGLWGSQSPSWTCQMALNPAHCPLPSHPFLSVSPSFSHFYIFKHTVTFLFTVLHSFEPLVHLSTYFSSSCNECVKTKNKERFLCRNTSHLTVIQNQSW